MNIHIAAINVRIYLREAMRLADELAKSVHHDGSLDLCVKLGVVNFVYCEMCIVRIFCFILGRLLPNSCFRFSACKCVNPCDLNVKTKNYIC